MRVTCVYCNTELPLSSTKFGVNIPGKKYCTVCANKRTFVLNRIRENESRLTRHYDILKKELQIIEEIKDLIKLGEEVEQRVKEYIETGKGFWEKYDHRGMYAIDKNKDKLKQEQFNNKPLPGEKND